MAEPHNTPVSMTPVPGATPRSASPVTQAGGQETPARPTVLHIGDEVCYNLDTYGEFSRKFHVVRPDLAARQRPAFMQALRDGTWGDFSAIFRPFWGSGGEMGSWDEELIALLPASCKVFASAGAGFDWADTEALGKKGIIYCNSGPAAAEAVSDFAVAMVIATFRHLPWCMGAATLAALSPSGAEAEQAFQACHAGATAQSHNLRGHVLGLIGLGNIGQMVAAKLGCPAFGMAVHYFDVARKPEKLERALGATFHSALEDLLGAADCVLLCTPASADGRPLISRDTIARMKPAARFVNVARGSLVDEDALADALESGKLSAAALDVHAAEPRVHPRLLRLATMTAAAASTTAAAAAAAAPARVMLTCHNAGGTVETHIGFEELSMRNIMAVLGGGEAMTPVNLHHVKRGSGGGD